nr:uncharacterized protein LOC118053926 [Populus alba]
MDFASHLSWHYYYDLLHSSILPETKPNQMGVHRLLPAVAPRGGRRLGRIFRPALSFRLWLLLLALLCLFSFAPFGLKFVILVGHGGSMESGISSSHQLHITGNIERFNEEVEQQQLHHYGYGGMQLKAQEESTVGSVR